MSGDHEIVRNLVDDEKLSDESMKSAMTVGWAHITKATNGNFRR